MLASLAATSMTVRLSVTDSTRVFRRRPDGGSLRTPTPVARRSCWGGKCGSSAVPGPFRRPASPVSQALTGSADEDFPMEGNRVSDMGDVFMGFKGDAQLFGMKGAVHSSHEKWKLRLQLMKPAAWAPLMLSVCYGISASGQFSWEAEQLLRFFVVWVMVGPCLAGFNQTMNDYFDRDIDAINEPYRPIPSGAISIHEAQQQIWGLLILGMSLAGGLDLWCGHDMPSISVLCALGAAASYAYSVPSIKLKKNGWYGGLAMAFCYIAMPWWVGELLYTSELPSETVALSLLLGLSAIGTSIVNDFKSVKGDTEMGLRSIPVMYGETGAKWTTVLMTNVPQLMVAVYLASERGQPGFAAFVGACVLAQCAMQKKYLFTGDILENDIAYMAHANPFQCLAILAISSALSHGALW